MRRTKCGRVRANLGPVLGLLADWAPGLRGGVDAISEWSLRRRRSQAAPRLQGGVSESDVGVSGVVWNGHRMPVMTIGYAFARTLNMKP